MPSILQVSMAKVNERDNKAKKFSLYAPADAFLPAPRLGVADKNSTGTEIIIRHDCDSPDPDGGRLACVRERASPCIRAVDRY